MVSLIYMRRAPMPDMSDLWQADADVFLNRFGFLPASMDNMVASMLDDYAKRLQQVGRTDDAEEMGRHADLLRESAQSDEGSFYLGFIPGDDLRDYADSLEEWGDIAASRELEELGERMIANNLAAYVCFGDFESCIDTVRAGETNLMSFTWQE